MKKLKREMGKQNNGRSQINLKRMHKFQFLNLEIYAPALYQLQHQQREIKAPNQKLREDLGQVKKGLLCSNTSVVSSGCLMCLGKKMYLLFLQKNHALDQDHGEI